MHTPSSSASRFTAGAPLVGLLLGLVAGGCATPVEIDPAELSLDPALASQSVQTALGGPGADETAVGAQGSAGAGSAASSGSESPAVPSINRGGTDAANAAAGGAQEPGGAQPPSPPPQEEDGAAGSSEVLPAAPAAGAGGAPMMEEGGEAAPEPEPEPVEELPLVDPEFCDFVDLTGCEQLGCDDPGCTDQNEGCPRRCAALLDCLQLPESEGCSSADDPLCGVRAPGGVANACTPEYDSSNGAPRRFLEELAVCACEPGRLL